MGEENPFKEFEGKNCKVIYKSEDKEKKFIIGIIQCKNGKFVQITTRDNKLICLSIDEVVKIYERY